MCKVWIEVQSGNTNIHYIILNWYMPFRGEYTNIESKVYQTLRLYGPDQRIQCGHMWTALHSVNLERINVLNHASLLCIIDEDMKRYVYLIMYISAVILPISYVLNGMEKERVNHNVCIIYMKLFESLIENACLFKLYPLTTEVCLLGHFDMKLSYIFLHWQHFTESG